MTARARPDNAITTAPLSVWSIGVCGTRVNSGWRQFGRQFNAARRKF